MSERRAEEDLVRLARSGDLDAYAELVRGHQAVAFRTALLICGDAAEAEEAAQDAFIKAHRALRSFRVGEPVRPWLLTIVANEARNRRRAAGRRAAATLRLAALPQPAVASPEEALLVAERHELLLAALGALGTEDRLVIGCRYLLELSENETAAALGVRPGTVKSRLSRALARMRVVLDA